MNPLDLSTDISAMSQGDIGSTVTYTYTGFGANREMDDANDWN